MVIVSHICYLEFLRGQYLIFSLLGKKKSILVHQFTHLLLEDINHLCCFEDTSVTSVLSDETSSFRAFVRLSQLQQNCCLEGLCSISMPFKTWTIFSQVQVTLKNAPPSDSAVPWCYSVTVRESKT